MLDALLSIFSRDIGIDLGRPTPWSTSGTAASISEPRSWRSTRRRRRSWRSAPRRERMVGRTPANIVAIRPLRDGVISDFDVTEQMIRYFVHRVHDRIGLISRPRMVLGIPSGVTEVEARAVRDARTECRRSLGAADRGADGRRDRGRAARSEPPGASSSTSAAGRPRSRSSPSAGSSSAAEHPDRRRRDGHGHRGLRPPRVHLLLGERTAEDIKIALGSASPGDWDAQRVLLRGRDLLTGSPAASRSGRTRSARRSSRRCSRSSTRSRTRSRRRRAGTRRRHHGPGRRPRRRRALLLGLDRRVARGDPDAVHIATKPLTCVARGTRRRPAGAQPRDHRPRR